MNNSPRPDYSDLLQPLPGVPRSGQDNPRFRTAEPVTAENAENTVRPPLVVNAEGTPRQPDARMPIEGRLGAPVSGSSTTLDSIEARINERASVRRTPESTAAVSPELVREAGPVEDPSAYWRPHFSTRRVLRTPLRNPDGSVQMYEDRHIPLFPENRRNQNAATGAEAQPTPESQETEKTRLQKLKGVISAFTRPYTWTGKSRGAYIAGVLVGGTATGLGFAGMGPGLRWGITGATYAASFALEKISRWHLKKQLTPDERLRFEERYKNARYKLSGFSSGLAASSLMSLGLHLAAPDTMHAIADAAKDIGSASARAGGRLAIKGAIGAMNAAGDVAEFAGNAQDAVIGGIEQFGDNAVNVLDQVGTGSGGGLFERAGDIASELMDHAPGGESSLTSPGAIAAWREFLQEQGENASTTWAELWNHVAASGAENSAEALAAAQEFAAQTGGEAGSVLGDFIEKYFNVNEVVVQQGQPLEHILNNLEVTGHAYNSTEWMTEFVGRNYEALKVGNEIGLNNFDKFVLANPDAPAEEVRKQFFRAVHWIYPGQKLEIPLP